MILHIPHASVIIPPDERASLVPDDRALERELLTSTDWFTDELFAFAGERRVVFPVSRLVVDPERFVDDEAEPMAARGRGVIYTRTVEGAPLRHPLSAKDRERLLDTYYRPHHRRFEDAVSGELEREGRVLIVDCHSFPSVPTLIDQHRDPPVRPQFCLGTDDYHTPEKLTKRARDYLTKCGYEVAINIPFSGTIVPLSRYRRDPRVQSIMIEVRRDLYIDEKTGKKNLRYKQVRQTIVKLLSVMSLSRLP